MVGKWRSPLTVNWLAVNCQREVTKHTHNSLVAVWRLWTLVFFRRSSWAQEPLNCSWPWKREGSIYPHLTVITSGYITTVQPYNHRPTDHWALYKPNAVLVTTCCACWTELSLFALYLSHCCCKNLPLFIFTFVNMHECKSLRHDVA